MIDGPLREQEGPHDAEGEGRSRFWDTPEAERAAQIPGIVALTKPGTAEQDRRFADGWLAELARWRRAKKNETTP